MNNFVRSDLAAYIAATAGFQAPVAAGVVDLVIAELRAALVHGYRIEIRGFGVLRVAPKRRGLGRDIRRGVMTPIPAGRTVRFRVGKALRCGRLHLEMRNEPG